MPNSNQALIPSADCQDVQTLLDTPSPGRTVAWVIGIYSVIWVAVTVLLSPVVPYDAVEAWSWGAGFEAGSPKNPWLIGAVAALGQQLPLSWPTFWYSSHILAVAIGAWGYWKLCERLIPDTRQALLAVLLMSFSATISIDMLPYNDNYLLMMLWPWMWFGFIRALFDDGRYWLLVGFAMGLAAMAKYTTVLYLPLMLVIVVWQGQFKAIIKQPWLWLGVLVGIALIAPNLYWLSRHDYAAFRWFSHRVGGDSAWTAVRVYAAVFYNALLIAGVLLLARWQWRRPTQPETLAFVFMAVVPVVLLGLYFLLRGGMRTEWMMPFAVPLGLAVIMCMTPSARGRFRLPLYTSGVIAALVLCGFGAAKAWQGLYSSRPRDHVPNLAVALNDWWTERYQQPLVYAGGSRMGDWMGPYAPDHPRTPTRWPSDAVRAMTPLNHSPYPNIYTPGLTDEELMRKGAMWVGEADASCSERNVLELDPSLGNELRQRIEYYTLVFRQDSMPRALFSICVGVLPPAPYASSHGIAAHAYPNAIMDEQ